MSFFTEFRPLFQILDDPSFFSPRSHQHFLGESALRQPAVHFAEDGEHYVVEAEVPGVKKENLSLTVGKDGKSLTIEGKAEERNPNFTSRVEAVDDTNSTAPSKELAKENTPNEVARQTWNGSGERFLRSMSFARTVWLPRPVDGNTISAKLEHGVLRVEMNKAKDQERTKVTIN